MLRRSQMLLAAFWGGLLLCVAFVAAPSAFAVLERAQAGLVVARLFGLEAARPNPCWERAKEELELSIRGA